MDCRFSSFLMVLFRNFVLSLFVGGVLFFFSPQTSAYMGNVCLHPLERMALFHGAGGTRSKKSSYKSEIKRLNASIRGIERRIDRQKDKLKSATDALGNSLDGTRLKDDAHDVADSITDYIQDEQNGWNCQEEGEATTESASYASLEFSFLPGVFGSLLPLLWETPQVYAEGEENIRANTVQFKQHEKESNCRKSGGQVKEFGRRGGLKVCDCSKFGKSVIADGSGRCLCPWDGPKGRVLLSCEEVRKIKEGVQSRQEAQQTCRRIYGVSVTRSVPSKEGPKCYCGGSQLCSTVYKQCQRYLNFKSLGANNSCQCVNLDEDGGRFLEPCTSRRAQKDFMKVCRKKYKSAVTRAVPMTGPHSGVRCYCGDQLCSSVSNQCRSIYGKKFTHIDLGNACICGLKNCVDSKKSQKTVDLIPTSLSVVVTNLAEKYDSFTGTDSDDNTVQSSQHQTPSDNKQHCKKWQKKKYFRRKGRVQDNSFCSDFGSRKNDCSKAFDDIRKEIKKINTLEARRKKQEESLTKWEDKQFEAQFSEDEDDSKTETGGLCIKCVTDLRRAAGPSAWQRFSSGLTVALGAGYSAIGFDEARRSQNETNQLLALQGMSAKNNFGHSLAGLSLGYPLISQGLRDLSRGSFACGPTPSPYPRPYPAYPGFY